MSFEMNSTALPIRKYPKIPQNYSNGCFSLGKWPRIYFDLNFVIHLSFSSSFESFKFMYLWNGRKSKKRIELHAKGKICFTK